MLRYLAMAFVGLSVLAGLLSLVGVFVVSAFTGDIGNAVSSGTVLFILLFSAASAYLLV